MKKIIFITLLLAIFLLLPASVVISISNKSNKIAGEAYEIVYHYNDVYKIRKYKDGDKRYRDDDDDYERRRGRGYRDDDSYDDDDDDNYERRRDRDRRYRDDDYDDDNYERRRDRDRRYRDDDYDEDDDDDYERRN